MKTRTQGFTLIELLVVIAIIGLLLSVLIPALQKSKEKTRALVCKTNLRSIGLGLRLYLDDYKNTAFDADEANGFFWKDANGKYLKPNSDDSYWGLVYLDYIDTPDVFACPSFQRVAELIYPVDPKLVQQAAFALNSNLNGKKISQLRSPSQFIVTHDHAEPKVENGSQDMFHNDGPGTMNLKHYRSGGGRSEFYRGIFRHNINLGDDFKTGGDANILWLDGHVDFLEETTGDNVPKRWYTGG